MMTKRQIEGTAIVYSPTILQRFRLVLIGVALAFGSAAVCRAQITSVPLASAKLDRTLTILLSSFGFMAKQIDLKAGTIAIRVQNRSGLSNLTFQVTIDGSSTVLLTGTHTAQKRDGDYIVTIAPGKYQLSIAEQPSWQCVLSVTN